MQIISGGSRQHEVDSIQSINTSTLNHLGLGLGLTLPLDNEVEIDDLSDV